jgi:hypothetical protein
MKKLIHTVAAALLAVGLCFGSMPAHAQEEDGFPFPPQAPAADPVPVNPAVKSVESGRVMVVVGSERHYGYHIGEVMPVTVVISVDPGIKLNFESLKRKILNVNGSDFEVIGSPVIGTPEQRNGKDVYTINLLMRSWVIQKDLVLNVDFHYATDMLPDGKTPNWKPVTTPDFVVTTSNTVSNSEKDLLPGDMSEKLSPKPFLVRPFKLADLVPALKDHDVTRKIANADIVPLDVAAVALMLPLPLWLLLLFVNRVRPGRKLSPAEAAWVMFDRVMAEAKEKGDLSYDNLNDIASALRAYLGIAQVPTSQAAVALDSFFSEYENKAEMLTVAVSALSKLDRALFSKSELTGAEKLLLLKEVERLCPRP